MKAIRSRIFHFLDKEKYEYFEDGLLIINNGIIEELGAFDTLVYKLDGQDEWLDKRDKLIIPGFVDGHIHAVQTKVLASYGADLLQWLDKYTFPEESKFKDMAYAHDKTDFFFHQLIKNGTTTAAIYSSVHENSVEAIAKKANKLNMRVLAGKTNMDRNAPEQLCEATNSSYSINKKLIDKYHDKERFQYIITPRFAITSSPQQLEQLSMLKKDYPHIKVQTHLSENHEEIQTTKELFPKAKNYLDVYWQYGLVDENSLFGHAIHLQEEEWEMIQDKKASLVHCPTSNLFLGSGLFDLKRAWEENIPLALGSDVGGGFSFSMLKTAATAYQVAALRGYKPTAFQLFYLLTLGGANALGLGHKIGNFKIGKEADFVCIDIHNSEVLEERLSGVSDIEEILFAILFLGDDRIVDSTYFMGEAYKKP